MLVDGHSAVGLYELPVVTLPGRTNESMGMASMILTLHLKCVQPRPVSHDCMYFYVSPSWYNHIKK